jgi:hypothetical protein
MVAARCDADCCSACRLAPTQSSPCCQATPTTATHHTVTTCTRHQFISATTSRQVPATTSFSSPKQAAAAVTSASKEATTTCHLLRCDLAACMADDIGLVEGRPHMASWRALACCQPGRHMLPAADLPSSTPLLQIPATLRSAQCPVPSPTLRSAQPYAHHQHGRPSTLPPCRLTFLAFLCLQGHRCSPTCPTTSACQAPAGWTAPPAT